MGNHLEYLLVELFGLTIAVVGGVYIYLQYVTYNYWHSRNVDYVKPVIVPFGSLWPVLSVQTSLAEFLRETYMKFKTSRVVGIYTFYRPMLVVNDPELIRFILTKEFSHFHDRGLYINEKADPVLGNLFLVPGAKWKHLRTKFTPTFTASKMKQMFFTIKNCSDTLASSVLSTASKSELIEVKDLMARFSTDVIASAAFGVQCNSIENPDAEFRKWGRKVFEPRPLRNALAIMFPSIMHLLNIRVIDQEISNFFINAFKETVQYRTANNVARKDFLGLVMQLIDKGYLQSDEKTESVDTTSDADKVKITMLEGAAQAFVFWLAGFETSSTTATYCLYEMALNPDIQEKVAEEINTVLAKFGGINYESIKEMHYLHKVVSETLRKYPSLPVLNRECTKDIELSDTGLCVTKGTPILIPVLGLHRDPEIYPNPEKFDPERFTEENIAKRHQFSYLAFGEGPRNCIGMRFGLIQTKVGLVSLLSRYRFKPSPNLKVPIELDKGNFVLSPKGGVKLRIEKRSVTFTVMLAAINSPVSITMVFFTDNYLLQILGVIVAIIGAAYMYLKHIVYSYWSSRGIIQGETTVPFGNLLPVLMSRQSIGEMLRDGYDRFKSKRVFGIYSFHRPTLVICDPDLIRFVLTKEFTKFHDRGMYVNEEVDPMSSHLFLLGGVRWKKMRAKLLSTFTSVKMKNYFGAVKDCTDNLVRCVADEVEKSDLVEVKDIMARFTTDVIASIAFGINGNSLQNPHSEFLFWGRKTLEPNPIRNTLLSACPPILKLLNLSTTDKGASDFFMRTFKDMVAYRKSAKVVRNDFMDLLMQLMDKGYVQVDDGKDTQGSEETGGRITVEEGAAQSFVFWLAGFETSSTTATYCLYEMALNPEIQEKVAEEINSVLKQFGGITYESIAKMVYLHKVVSETLRKYPIVPQLNRECNQDVDLPNSGFNVPAGTPIFIPVFGIHRDPEFYPEPEKFDPERFSDENIAKRHRYAYLPFGEGPRTCIGMRFGYLQTKMGLIVLLAKYRFKPAPDMEVPLPLDKGKLLHGPIGGVTLLLEER
nr:uncharacterized protein LOC124223738 [Neodiprion pinetum]